MNGPSIIDGIKFAAQIVKHQLALQPGEEVVIIADTYTERDMLDAMAGAIAGAGAEFTIVTQPARTRPSEIHKLTRSALRAYEGADVIIPATGSCGVSQYGASAVMWPLLGAKKARVFTLSERSLGEMTEGAAGADYGEVERVGLQIIGSLAGVDTVRATTALGTDITFRVKGRDLINLASFARQAGDEGGIPSGEVTVNPIAGVTEGVLVVDGPIGYIGRPKAPLTLVARAGEWVEVRGKGSEADKLRGFFDTMEHARNVAEFAMGTNAWARQNGVVSEEKKRLGTMHTAFGRSTRTADWRCEVWSKIHGDLVVYAPTIEANGKVIMSGGVLVV
jgi:leucyl aminopeptidase (aminopeptidase T)